MSVRVMSRQLPSLDGLTNPRKPAISRARRGGRVVEGAPLLRAFERILPDPEILKDSTAYAAVAESHKTAFCGFFANPLLFPLRSRD